MTGNEGGCRVLAIAATVLGASLVPVPTAAQSVAIAPVTVIDVRDGEALPDRTVVVTGNRITAVGPTASVEVPVGARVVDGTGKYLIPGFWDMHVHLFNQISGRQPNRWYFPLWVANGVTGVREMWAKPIDVSTLTEWRQRTATGELLAPRIAAAGALVDGPGSWWPSADSVATPGEAREFVRGASADGLDFVKVYSSLSREAYFAILDEAKHLGIPVAGHIPLVVRASAAAAAGQRSNEHLHQIREGCSTSEERIISERRKLYAGPFTTAQDDSLWERHERMRTNGYDPERCATLAAQLAAAGMWQVPTLVNERSYFLGPEEGAERDPRLAYLPPDERRFWREGLDNYTDIETASQGGLDERLRRWEVTKDVVSVLARGGVPFLAGTDLGIPGLYPGFSLHDELELLVEAGLTPSDALRAATLEPARYLEATDSLGTVEPGKLADLVLLDANPLEDISSTRTIHAVVVDGRYLDRAALDKLLEKAERAAGQQDAVRDSVPPEDRPPAGELQDAEVPRTRTFSGLVAPAFPYAQPEEVGLSSETLDRLGDEIAAWTSGEWLYDGELVGAELLVIKDGKAVFHEAYGWSDREARVPVRRNSIWSIKSMSKPFTATAALMLADEGNLSLDDPVSRYIPTFPDDSTTIRHLLTQTSGYGGDEDDYDWTSLRTLVESWAADGPSESWEEFHYSDFNFAALGYIVGEASGTPIDRFTEERIIEPLGLDDTSTGFSDDPVWRARLNPWYRWNEDVGQYDLRWATNRGPWDFYNAAWGMFSTAMDYAEFMALWMNGGEWQGTRLLSKETVEEALRPHGTIDGHGLYGYGWFVDDVPAEEGQSFSHGGGDGTLAMAFPADDLIVVYMTHSRGGHHKRALVNRLYMSDLVTHPGLDPEYLPLAWADEADVDTVDFTAEQQARYVGTFQTEEEPARVAVVWEEGRRLHLRYGPEGVKADLRYDLVPVGDHRFALGNYDDGGRLAVTVDPPYRVRFLMENGAAQALELRRSDEIVFRALPVSSSAQASGD